MNKKKIAVIFGGQSSEHEISCISAATVISGIDPEKYDPAAFIALRDQKIAALADAASPLRIVGSAVVPFEFCCENPRILRQFAIGSSDYILVDLPRVQLTEEFCDRISRLHIVSGLCPVAADIDRHYTLWSPEELIALRKCGILLQISADGLLRQEFRKLSLFLLANQHALFIATGGRSITEPLRFIEAMRIVQRSLPAQLYRRIKNNAGADGYYLKAGDSSLVLLPDDPKQIKEMLSNINIFEAISA